MRLERYLSGKNPIHGRETASIFRFSGEIFESDFSQTSTGDVLAQNIDGWSQRSV